MEAVNIFKFHGFDFSLPFATKARINTKAPKTFLPYSQLCRDKIGPICGDSALRRLRISYGGNKGMEQCFRVSTIPCSTKDINGEDKEKEQSSSLDYQQGAAIDLKLPRRSLLVTFTCDACGVRSQRLINRLAYERGLVYVQCSGCSQYHKLVDNLGLVIEYNLQEEIDVDATTDQV